MRGAAAGRESFCFFDPDETEDLAGESREPEKICGTGEKPGAEMEQGDITPKGTGKGRKWAQVAHTQGQAREDRTNGHSITSKMAQLPHTRHRRGRHKVKKAQITHTRKGPGSGLAAFGGVCRHGLSNEPRD